MKKYGLIFSSAVLIAALVIYGQEAAPPSVDLFPEQEEEEASPTPDAPVASRTKGVAGVGWPSSAFAPN